MTAPSMSPQVRCDFIKPVVIFGGVFLLSVAFCGAVDSMGSGGSFVEEVKVVRAEGAAGGHDADLLVACNKQAHSSELSDVRCRKVRYQAALLQ